MNAPDKILFLSFLLRRRGKEEAERKEIQRINSNVEMK